MTTAHERWRAQSNSKEARSNMIGTEKLCIRSEPLVCAIREKTAHKTVPVSAPSGVLSFDYSHQATFAKRHA